MFNDPFDGNIPVRWDLLTYDDCIELNMEMLKSGIKEFDPNALREYAKKVTDGKTLWHPENIKKEDPEQMKKWDSIIGLFSLSTIRDNILMWSHYADNHKGFVIGFDPNCLIEKLDVDFLEPITYQKEYPLITGFDETEVRFYKKFFFKSILWEYEQEWRISKNHISIRTMKFPPEAVKEIICGCAISQKNIDEIIIQCKKHFGDWVELYRAEKDEDNFGLSLISM